MSDFPPPGVTLAEWLAAERETVVALARRTGMSIAEIDGLLALDWQRAKECEVIEAGGQ